MAKLFECDINGEVYEREKVGSDILTSYLLVRNRVAPKGFSPVGDMHVSTEELPERIKKDIGDITPESKLVAELSITLSGAMLPRERQAGIVYIYNEDEPEITSLSLSVIETGRGDKNKARTHTYKREEIREFVKELEANLSENIQRKEKKPDEEEKVNKQDKGFR